MFSSLWYSSSGVLGRCGGLGLDEDEGGVSSAQGAGGEESSGPEDDGGGSNCPEDEEGGPSCPEAGGGGSNCPEEDERVDDGREDLRGAVDGLLKGAREAASPFALATLKADLVGLAKARKLVEGAPIHERQELLAGLTRDGAEHRLLENSGVPATVNPGSTDEESRCGVEREASPLPHDNAPASSGGSMPGFTRDATQAVGGAEDVASTGVTVAESLPSEAIPWIARVLRTLVWRFSGSLGTLGLRAWVNTLPIVDREGFWTLCKEALEGHGGCDGLSTLDPHGPDVESGLGGLDAEVGGSVARAPGGGSGASKERCTGQRPETQPEEEDRWQGMPVPTAVEADGDRCIVVVRAGSLESRG